MEPKHIIKPPGLEKVDVFCSPAPDGSKMYNVYGTSIHGDTVLGPMFKDRDEAIDFWNGMFSKAVKS